MKKLLIIIRIEAGLGDVNWGFRLLENLKRDYEVTLVFINCMKKQEAYLSQHRKYKLKHIQLPLFIEDELIKKEEHKEINQEVKDEHKEIKQEEHKEIKQEEHKEIKKDKVIKKEEHKEIKQEIKDEHKKEHKEHKEIKNEIKNEIKKEVKQEIKDDKSLILICKNEKIHNKDIIRHSSFFHKILNFHIDLKNPLNHPQVINFDEYGKNTNEIRILFRHFKEDYGSLILNISNLITLKGDEETFRDTLNLNKEEFNIKLIRDLSRDQYYFSYFAKLSLIHEVLTFFYFIKKLSEYSDLQEFSVLTNYNFKNMISNPNFESVEMILRRELDQRGFSETYYRLFYINESGKFRLKYNQDYDLDVDCNGKIMHILSYEVLTKYEFDYLLLKSGDIVGCTGDMSISETISTNRVFIYQTLSHKLNFRRILSETFKKFHGDEDYLLDEVMFDPCLIRHSEKIRDFKIFKEKWSEFCIKILRNNCFMRWLNEELK